jgi:hypothetical protein
MTTLTTCSSFVEAQLLKSVLDDAGLPAFLPDELMATTAPQTLFVSGVRLQVEDEDADEARRVLASLRPPAAPA